MLRDAAAMFDRCSRRFPDLFEARYNLALAWIGLNDYPSAQKTLDSISSPSVREKAAKQYLQGKIYSATGRMAEARESLENAYRGNPDDENYVLDLALLYIRGAAYMPAIEVLEPSLVRHPESEELGIELALSNALAGREAEALAVCKKLRERNPQLSTPRLVAAFAYCSAVDYKDCETEASAGLFLPDANPYLHYLYAEALWNSNPADGSKPLAELNAAIKAMPLCSACLLLRSRVFEAKTDYGAAIADIRTVLRQDSTSGQAWYRLAALCRKTGDSRGAADALNHYHGIHEKQTSQEVESFRRAVAR
jgi:predicted Zn-dependent protease